MHGLSSLRGNHARNPSESGKGGSRLDKKAKSHHDVLWRAWYTDLQTMTIPAFSINALNQLPTDHSPMALQKIDSTMTSTPSSAVFNSTSGINNKYTFVQYLYCIHNYLYNFSQFIKF